MLINLRGTHGSGKTYVSHKLIENYLVEKRVEPEYVLGKHFVKTNCHVLQDDLYIIGRYKSGMDGIFPQEIVEEMIEYWAPKGHVIWENVMVSANVGRWAVLSKKLDPVNHNVWCFLDTPLQVCIDRMFQRRAEASDRGFNHRQEDSEVKLDVLAGHWRRCRRAAVRAVQEGIDVRWIDHTQAYDQVHALLTEEGHWLAEEGDTPVPWIAPASWKPTQKEIEYVLKTARLPWEPEDTQTKVDFISPPRMKFKMNLDEQLGVKVQRWGAGIEDEEQLGVVVSNWNAYNEKLKREESQDAALL